MKMVLVLYLRVYLRIPHNYPDIHFRIQIDDQKQTDDLMRYSLLSRSFSKTQHWEIPNICSHGGFCMSFGICARLGLREFAVLMFVHGISKTGGMFLVWGVRIRRAYSNSNLGWASCASLCIFLKFLWHRFASNKLMQEKEIIDTWCLGMGIEFFLLLL